MTTHLIDMFNSLRAGSQYIHPHKGHAISRYCTMISILSNRLYALRRKICSDTILYILIGKSLCVHGCSHASRASCCGKVSVESVHRQIECHSCTGRVQPVHTYDDGLCAIPVAIIIRISRCSRCTAKRLSPHYIVDDSDGGVSIHPSPLCIINYNNKNNNIEFVCRCGAPWVDWSLCRMSRTVAFAFHFTSV